MDYYSLQGSCMLSILLPGNFLIGEYIKMCKKKGKKHWLIDVVVLIVSIAVAVKLIYDKEDPFIPFIVIGCVVVGIVQNSYIYRKMPVELSFEKYLSLALGVFLILLPYMNFFEKRILSDVCDAVRIICYIIYFIWGLEKIAFGIMDIYCGYKRDS